MSYGETTEMKCPNPLCGYMLERTDYGVNPPPIPLTPNPMWAPVGSGDEPCSDCPECGVALEELFRAVEKYRVAREAFLKADAASDRAFRNWWHRMHSGASTNAGRATHLANLANYASADLSGAEGYIWRHEVDPRDVDAADGVDALKDRAV